MVKINKMVSAVCRRLLAVFPFRGNSHFPAAMPTHIKAIVSMVFLDSFLKIV